MKSVLVPLPAPGAPLSQKISLGKRSCSSPNSSSRLAQTELKMICASLTSRSRTLGSASLVAVSAVSEAIFKVFGSEGKHKQCRKPIVRSSPFRRFRPRATGHRGLFRSWTADPLGRALEVFFAGEDINLEAQIVDGDGCLDVLEEADRILLGRHDHFKVGLA